MGISCSAGVAGREPATLFSVGVTGRDVRGTGVGTLRGTGVGTRGGGVGRRGGSRTVEAIKFVSLCRPSATSNSRLSINLSIDAARASLSKVSITGTSTTLSHHV